MDAALLAKWLAAGFSDDDFQRKLQERAAWRYSKKRKANNVCRHNEATQPQHEARAAAVMDATLELNPQKRACKGLAKGINTESEEALTKQPGAMPTASSVHQQNTLVHTDASALQTSNQEGSPVAV